VSSKWDALQAEFVTAHEDTGIGAKDWCESKGLNYSTARRYIKPVKVPKESKAKGTAKKQALVIKPVKKKEVVKKSHNAIKHGGYSKYFSRNISELVDGTTLVDELDLCRSRIHLVITTIEQIHEKLKESPDAETAASLFESLFKADNALDRNIARVESIVKTMSSIELDNLNQRKIIADTDRIIKTAKATVINARKSEVQTELAELQVAQARKDAGGTSKLDQFIDELTGGKVDQVVG